jgi:FkbM family methyltransferase
VLASVLRRLLRRGAGRSPAGSPAGATPLRSEAAAWLEKALQLQREGRYDELIAQCQSTLQREPRSVEALQLIAVALCAAGRAREGIIHLTRVTELTPDAAEAHSTLATVLAASGDAEAAIASYRKAVALKPDLGDAWAGLAAMLKVLGRYDEAEDCCRSGLKTNPRHAGLHHVLSCALFEQGRVEEAVSAVRTCLAIAPEMHAAHSDLVRMLNYSDAAEPDAIFAEHRAWGERHANALTRAAAPHDNKPVPDRRLRVGFVSPYFRKHAMTFFFESVVAHHDRERMKIFLFADVAQPDEYSERLKAHGATWRPTVGLSDDQLAQAVREDSIDILVDLSGHTPYNRLLAFARRPSPVQVTWNGYPNTTGMAAIDYRITDAYCDPPGKTEALHTEQLVRLPGIYMTWQPPADAPEPGPPPAASSGRFTFGSFNSCFKITPNIVALWARTLHAVPGSRLMLLTITSHAAGNRVRGLFSEHGIGPDRLQIVPRVSHEAFLEAHQGVDVALDSYPYHGTTTTAFSLWMGLPVVVLAGPTHVSRVGVSLLNNLGMPELVAQSREEYVQIATKLAADLHALAALRSTLRHKMLESPITDGARGARRLESAFRQMWSNWSATKVSHAVGGSNGKALRQVVLPSVYGPLMFPRQDTMIAPNVARDGWWEKDEIELLRWFMVNCFAGEPEVEVLDVGAYTGVYTIALARFPFSRLTVHAFEAQREIYDMLAATVALNGLDNVCCHHKAVSAESGKVIEFDAVDYDAPANFGSVEIETAAMPDFDGRRLGQRTETVETLKIDDLALARVRLMKIDAEGMEHKVLAGASETIRRCRPLIFVEHEKTDFAAVKAFLRDANYRSYYAQRPNILCVPAEITHIRIENARSVEY